MYAFSCVIMIGDYTDYDNNLSNLWILDKCSNNVTVSTKTTDVNDLNFLKFI